MKESQPPIDLTPILTRQPLTNQIIPVNFPFSLING